MNRIIVTDPRIKDGTMMYFDEYVILDLECEEVQDDIIVDNSYNIYVDDKKLERDDIGDLTKEYPVKYKAKE